MNFTKVKFRRWAIVLVVLTGLGVFLWPVPSEPYSPQQVRSLVDRLNYNAAVVTPHLSLGKETRALHVSLFSDVEAGKPLDLDRSAQYRLLYQEILKQNQRSLSIFDWNLTVLLDHGMVEKNNVGGLGIAGAHDHHDFSSHSNYASLRSSLAKLERPREFPASPARVLQAMAAHKDLTDIILHMATAPQTKSTPYHPRSMEDDLDREYASVLENFKAAQFQPVNSPAYVASLHRALDSYDRLVLLVQGRLLKNTNDWERAVAGPWLSWRSLGPDLKDKQAGPFARSTSQADH